MRRDCPHRPTDWLLKIQCLAWLLWKNRLGGWKKKKKNWNFCSAPDFLHKEKKLQWWWIYLHEYKYIKKALPVKQMTSRSSSSSVVDSDRVFFSSADSCSVCVPQVPGGHLLCLSTDADDGLGAVRGWLCQETGARKGAEAAWGNALYCVKWDKPCHCFLSGININHANNWFMSSELLFLHPPHSIWKWWASTHSATSLPGSWSVPPTSCSPSSSSHWC